MKLLVPRALRAGDTIGLVAPAGVLDRQRIERAVERLEAKGLRVKTYGDIYRTYGYLAGDDTERADELMQAFGDEETRAVVPARGGTGITRLLDMLDYSVIRRHPKILTGFSDITALHLAVQSQANLVSFHSPNPMDGLGMPDGLSELSDSTFWRALWADSYAGFPASGYVVPLPDSRRQTLVTFSGGKAQGRLVGGNLALVCSLLGTPYEIETDNNILLLEDVGEQPYRIDRFLSQLRLAGKLDVLNGVVLGQFTDCLPAEDKPSLTLEDVFRDYFEGLGIPVLQDFPTGHTRDNATLPLGVEVQLDADRKQLTVLQCPVRLD